MKKPDEIKKGLECCTTEPLPNCLECPYWASCEIEGGAMPETDALAYIQQLEAELEAVKRERDAVLYDMKLVSMRTLCGVCAYQNPDKKTCGRWEILDGCFEWRGLCKENGGATDD